MDKIHARIQESVYTKTEWEAANPILLKGEKGFVSDDPNLFKIGDGVTAWNNLPWRGYTGTIAQVTGDNENAVMSQKATTTTIETEKNRAEAAEKAIIFDVSAHNDGAVFESLSALLSSSNLSTLIPTSVRHGGMSIRFIQGSEQSSDNKYLQYRCMAKNFTTDVTQWQGVDDEPTAGSQNLVTSGGVNRAILEVKSLIVDEEIFNYDLEVTEGQSHGKGYQGLCDIQGGTTVIVTSSTGYVGSGDWYDVIFKAGTIIESETVVATTMQFGSKTIYIPSDVHYIRILTKDSVVQTGTVILKIVQKASLIANNLTTDDPDKILSAKQGKILKTSLDSIESRVFTDNVISEGFVLSSSEDWDLEVGFVGSGGIIIPTETDYRIATLPVMPNTPYKLSMTSETGAFTRFQGTNCYDKSGNLLSTIVTGSQSEIKNWVFTTPENCAYIKCTFYRTLNVSFIYMGGFTTKEILNLYELDANAEDFDILIPPTIFGRTYDANSVYTKYNNNLYPEGFVLNKSIKTINGGKETGYNTLSKTGTFTKNIKLSNGSVEKTISLQCKNVNPSNVTNNKVFLLVIGESTTDMSHIEPYSRKWTGGWGIPSMIRYFSMRDQVDNVGADIVTLGTRGNLQEVFSYKTTESALLASHHTAHGGWSSYTYLNWPCPAKMDANIAATWFTQESMWYGAGLASKTPYNQSSYNPDRQEFTGSAAQIELISKTPVGKYKIDGSHALWNIISYLSGRTDATTQKAYPVFTGSGSYEGTSAQIAAMQTWMDALCNDPMNEFYSVDEARTGNSGTAFSLDTYMQRYRNCDDLGVALVGNPGETVTGSDGNTYTIGTDITGKDVMVCTPTHILLNIGINDSDTTPLDVSVYNIKKLIERLGNYPIGYFMTRWPGVSEQGAWGDVANTFNYPISTAKTSLMQTLKTWFDTQQTKTMIASYPVQYPASQSDEILMDIDSPNPKIDCSTVDVHLGYYGERAIAWQCLHWLYSIL